MQLSLFHRFGRRDDSLRDAPSTVPGAWRDSAISQLETIAAANGQPRQTVGPRDRSGWGFALGGALLLLGVALWQPPGAGVARQDELPLVADSAPPRAPQPTVVVPQLTTAAAVAPPDAAVVGDAAEPSAESAAAMDPTMTADDEEAARKARLAAQARRNKAALLAQQERQRADEEAARLQQEAERAQALRAQQQQQLAEAARAAEQARRLAEQQAQHARRGVAELCASNGLAGELACQVRTCWKAEHQGDATCVRLREIELARQQRGSEH